ncbi:hypothetical protein GWK47_030630 [Chionoecetes opilio]|uniref:Uncharacterized protein n=1 Tax=Chionoecetes opilio TaxID=41210 RepID=A0A8J5D2G7_CHIOP|nr:hypothetical protein GWK47_030630 [Chionoecetes opilio]
MIEVRVAGEQVNRGQSPVNVYSLRCKAFNTAQLVVFMVEIFDVYMRQRLVDVALGRRRVKNNNIGTVSMQSITSLGVKKFIVKSQTNPDESYDIDLSIGMCTCPKAALAVGDERTPDESFFRGLTDEPQENERTPDESFRDLTDEPQETILNQKQVKTEKDEEDEEKNTLDATKSTSSIEEKTQEAFEVISEVVRKFGVEGPEGTVLAIDKWICRLKNRAKLAVNKNEKLCQLEIGARGGGGFGDGGVGITPVLRGLVAGGRQAAPGDESWRDAGPHTTLLGERGGSAWWSPRGCGFPFSDSWLEVLPMVVASKERLACLERQVQQAEQEHNMFVIWFVMTVCMMVVGMSVALVAACSWARHTLARHQCQKEQVSNALLLKEDDLHLYLNEAQHCLETPFFPLQRRVLVVVFQVMTSDGLMTRQGRYVHFDDDGRLAGARKALPLPPPGGTVQAGTSVRVDADPMRDPNPDGKEDEEANRLVRRSLIVPRRFVERLAGPGDVLRHYLAGRYSVQVFQDKAGRKVHVKGGKTRVLKCLAAYKAAVT